MSTVAGDKAAMNDNWVVECSDDEACDHPSLKEWLPATDDIIRLYKALHDKTTIELEWKCPGRRSPSPPVEDVDSVERETNFEETPEKPPTEFDFEDVFPENTATKLKPRRTPGSAKLKGSGQKRVASFKQVMFDIRRQMHLESMEKSSPSDNVPTTNTPKKEQPPKGIDTDNGETSMEAKK